MVVVPDQLLPLVGLLREPVRFVVEGLGPFVVSEVLREVPSLREQRRLEGREVANRAGEGRASIEIRQSALDLPQLRPCEEQVVVYHAQPSRIVRSPQRLAGHEEVRPREGRVPSPRVFQVDESSEVREHAPQLRFRREACHPPGDPFDLLQGGVVVLSGEGDVGLLVCEPAARQRGFRRDFPPSRLNLSLGLLQVAHQLEAQRDFPPQYRPFGPLGDVLERHPICVRRARDIPHAPAKVSQQFKVRPPAERVDLDGDGVPQIRDGTGRIAALHRGLGALGEPWDDLRDEDPLALLRQAVPHERSNRLVDGEQIGAHGGQEPLPPEADQGVAPHILLQQEAGRGHRDVVEGGDLQGIPFRPVKGGFDLLGDVRLQVAPARGGGDLRAPASEEPQEQRDPTARVREAAHDRILDPGIQEEARAARPIESAQGDFDYGRVEGHIAPGVEVGYDPGEQKERGPVRSGNRPHQHLEE